MPETTRPGAYRVTVTGTNHTTMTAVVIAYGPDPVNETLLETLAAGSDTAVVVVRNNSFRTATRAGSADALPGPLDKPGFVHEIALNDNVGYAAAANIGAAVRSGAVQSDVIVFVTPDVTVELDCLEALRCAFENPRLGAAGPLLHVGAETWFGGTWGRSGHARHRNSINDPRPVRWLDGSCLAVRTTAFEEVGGFDEGTFLYGDDLGLCLTLHRRGYDIVQLSDSHATQHSGMRHRSGAHGYLLLRNEIRIARQLDGPTGALRVAIASLLRVVVEVARARKRASRRHHLRQAAGMAVGILDGVRGRSGPPPRRFRRWSDIRTAQDSV
jgi:N-acetylglucosaminyl-diphospho-decaprenol L-rhamnosyltransferase